MFRELTIRGRAASLLWGYHTAVSLTSWAITKVEGQWLLSGAIGRIDRFQARQTPLLFTAPHERGRDGWWAWGVNSIEIGEHRIVAKLGPPEQ